MCIELDIFMNFSDKRDQHLHPFDYFYPAFLPSSPFSAYLFNFFVFLFFMASSFWNQIKTKIKKEKWKRTYHGCDFVFEIIIQEFACLYEKLLDILSCSSWCLEGVLYVLFTFKLFYFFNGDFTLVFHIFLVSN